MPVIATLEQLKDELGLVGVSAFDDRLTRNLEIAEEAVLDYVRQRLGDEEDVAAWSDEVDSWDEDTAPMRVLGAILKMACHLFRETGDLHTADTPTTYLNELPRDVTAIVARLRDPGMA